MYTPKTISAECPGSGPISYMEINRSNTVGSSVTRIGLVLRLFHTRFLSVNFLIVLNFSLGLRQGLGAPGLVLPGF